MFFKEMGSVMEGSRRRKYPFHSEGKVHLPEAMVGINLLGKEWQPMWTSYRGGEEAQGER